MLPSLWPFDKPVQNGFKCRGLINCLDHATATESNDEFPELLYSLLQAIFHSVTANFHKVKLEPIIYKQCASKKKTPEDDELEVLLQPISQKSPIFFLILHLHDVCISCFLLHEFHPRFNDTRNNAMCA